MPIEPQNLETWLSQGLALPPVPHLSGMTELGKGLVVAATWQRLDHRPVVVVLATKPGARNLVDHLKFLNGRAFAEQKLHYLPALEFDYYRGLLPNPDLAAERNVGLFHALNDAKGRCFVTTVPALLQKVFPPAEYLTATQFLKPNDEVDRDALAHALLEAGYQRQPTVYDPGVFAVRGGVIDVFSPLYVKPLRIELFGDLIDEIRFFDPQSQRTLEKLELACLVPVATTLLPRGEAFAESALKLKERLDAMGVPKQRRDELLEKIQDGHLTAEMALLFPLLSRGSVSLLEYLPKDAVIFWEGKEQVLESARQEITRLYKSHELFETEVVPIAARGDLFLSLEELGDSFDKPDTFFLESFSSAKASLSLKADEIHLERERQGMHQKGTLEQPLQGFATRFRQWMDDGYRVHIACHTQTHAEKIRVLLAPYGIAAEVKPETLPAWPEMLKADFRTLSLWQGFVNDSRVFPELRLAVLGEEEIFGRKKRSVRQTPRMGVKDPTRVLAAFRDLKVNDFIVHKEHGIGRYLGLKTMEFAGVTGDYVLIEYKDGDKLYIPVYRLNVLQKYGSSEGAVPVLDKLGGDRWAKATSKARRAVAELAAEFLNTAAKRRLAPAHAFSAPGAEYSQFEMEFPFDETPDQLKAIQDIQRDLNEPHPMDRLLCGDVGYGKTEVAMRAAMRAVLDHKQVAILVPTTVLAFQHHSTFRERFKDTGARVEMVSRLKSPSEIRQTLLDTKEGKVDILVGTHRLLSADITFRDLGLVVIDEEHRFGVVHKERLKKLCESVHVLSMTATPIPRTLNMAMAGIKDISILTTPPPDRLSVRTFVCRRSPEVMVEAITNELSRDGQVFFVHNRIETLFAVADELKALLPKVSFEIAHGQMDGEELEKKMLAFYRGEAQVLLSTAIIESGLDIPRANTILIDQADHFGLAQLYQLRGRVGRGALRAYCYLLIPGENAIGEDAKQRLQVIQRYTELGSGFSVASHDLELRGAGDLLGRDQSGHITAVGVDLYLELLEESVLALKGQAKGPEIEPEITMKIAAYFPEAYLADVAERVNLYRRLSSAESEEEISEIETEIRDRFGSLPPEVSNLLGLMTLKLYLKKLHVTRMSCGPRRTSLQFAPSTPASPEKLVKLIQRDKDEKYQLTPDQKLVFSPRELDWKGQLAEVKRLCEVLGVS